MKLLTATVRKAIPALYSTDGQPAETRKVRAKFFTPWGNWTWYVLEGEPDGDDFRFFGLVVGQETEFGYFSLNELQAVRGRFGLGIERDIHWNPQTTLADLQGALATRGHA